MILVSVIECSQSKGANPKMREHKLRSGVKWHRVLKQNGIKLTEKKDKGAGYIRSNEQPSFESIKNFQAQRGVIRWQYGSEPSVTENTYKCLVTPTIQPAQQI
jgi:hypothetical protein